MKGRRSIFPSGVAIEMWRALITQPVRVLGTAWGGRPGGLLEPISSLIAALSVVIVLAPVSAAGQELGPYTSPGAAVMPDRPMSGKDRARAMLLSYADCILRVDRSDAMRAITAPPGPESDRMLTKIAVDECLGAGELRFSPQLLRGALYIDLYRRDYRGKTPAISAEPLDFAGGVSIDDPRRQNIIGMLSFADCVIRADPLDARQIVFSPVASREESKGYAGLMPHLSACLPKGKQFVFSKISLSGAIAEVLYREAVPEMQAPGNQ